jgi:ribonuclease P protein component
MTGLSSLKGDRAFQRLRKGRPGHAQFLSTRWLPDKEGYIRVGIVVTKQLGKAVVRNRVRRRLREGLRALLLEAKLAVDALFQGKPSFSLIIIARPEAAEASYWQLKSALNYALKKARLFL